jgi:hypothetical protein
VHEGPVEEVGPQPRASFFERIAQAPAPRIVDRELKTGLLAHGDACCREDSAVRLWEKRQI